MEARAQISGVVGDAVAARRVPGAVLTVFDSTRRVLVRTIADDSGRFRLPARLAARRMRVVKIGYRPVEIAVTPNSSHRIMLERLPNMLEPVLASAQPRCPRSATRPAAFGLWEQARAALLGSVVARETNIARVRRLNFRRYMNDKGDAIARQSVRIDSGLALRSFDASYTATEFMARGFAEPEGSSKLRFHGPDAEVLLSDALADHYCLDLASATRERPAQVGLRFHPIARQPGRVDLDGILWIDTAARVLRDIEYTYLGLDTWADPWHPGGTIAFRETSPATLWIDRWWIRMTGASIRPEGRPAIARVVSVIKVVEAGAELSSARWPDGRTWKAALGRAEISLVNSDGRSVGGARVQLDSTDYHGVSDAAGRLVLDELLPGPYSISVIDTLLAIADTALPAAGFVAGRDSVSRVRAVVPTVAEFVAKGCRDQDSYDRRSQMFVARIVDSTGEPMAGAQWMLVPVVSDRVNVPDGFFAAGSTGTEGLIFVCQRLARFTDLYLRVWRGDMRVGKDVPVAETRVLLRDRITVVKLRTP